MSLRLNRLRSMLSILGIVFGVMAVMVIIAVGEGMKNEALQQIEQLGIRNIYIRAIEVTAEKKVVASKNHGFGLTWDDLVRIRSGCATVENVAALKELNAAIIGGPREITPQVVSVTPSYGEALDLRLEGGRFISQRDCLLQNEVCVIGREISRSLGRSGQLGGIIRIEDHFFKIVGILGMSRQGHEGKTENIAARNYDEMILLPLGTMVWLAGAGDRQVGGEGQSLTELILQIDAPEHVLDSSRVIKRIMTSLHPDVQAYQIIIPLELLNQTRKAKRMLTLFLVTIASISLLVGGVGIMNIMLATVSERKKEIGIRRAVGAKKKHILVQFLTESAILTFLGGVIGISLGGMAMIILSFFIPWQVDITVEAIIFPLLISSVAGLFFGIYPAYKATAVDPIQALRS